MNDSSLIYYLSGAIQLQNLILNFARYITLAPKVQNDNFYMYDPNAQQQQQKPGGYKGGYKGNN